MLIIPIYHYQKNINKIKDKIEKVLTKRESKVPF
jgi:hypothetical protein